MGVAIHQKVSFPVGKVEFMNLYPLNFTEFLMALKQDLLLKFLTSRNWNQIKADRIIKTILLCRGNASRCIILCSE